MMQNEKLLKRDTFGAVYSIETPTQRLIKRDIASAPRWALALARWLGRREARALARLAPVAGFARLHSATRDTIIREFVAGVPMHVGKPTDKAYFKSAFSQLRAMHRRGVVHNDLAKEPNWLVTEDGLAAIVDYQLAGVFKHRSRLFRMLAREDLRHYLKHKRTYRPNALSQRELSILATPSITTRIWHQTGKRVYLFVTRRLMGWSDREGASDRGRNTP